MRPPSYGDENNPCAPRSGVAAVTGVHHEHGDPRVHLEGRPTPATSETRRDAVGRQSRPRLCRRQSIEILPSGWLRVKVYSGYDPVSGKRHYLDEVVRTGLRAKAEAEKARTRLLHEVDE